MTQQPNNRMEKRLNPKDVKPGDIITFIYFATVKDLAKGPLGDHSLSLKNLDNGNEFEVHGDALIEPAYSADRYLEEKPVSRTKMVKILEQSYNVPFTVVFIKQTGEERTLRGRMIGPVEYGRSLVEDLDIQSKENNREVDHRTLQSLIVNGKKYILKK
jgi:hypothetical protein